MPINPERDHIRGLLNVPLTLVEYGDYQCPYCGAAYPEVKEVQRKLGSKLRFVFRNFPITSSHEFAERAAEIERKAKADSDPTMEARARIRNYRPTNPPTPTGTIL